jgi:hypothetical protein
MKTVAMNVPTYSDLLKAFLRELTRVSGVAPCFNAVSVKGFKTLNIIVNAHNTHIIRTILFTDSMARFAIDMNATTEITTIFW